MGTGLSTEIGDSALFYENLQELESVSEKIGTNDISTETLDLSNRYVGEEGIARCRMQLKVNTMIRSLNLSYNKLSDNAIGLICEALSDNPVLEVLNLSGNAMTEQGASFVAALLQANSSLHTLVLFNCNLDDKCALHLANALQQNNTLHTLNLAMNNCSDAACDFFLQALNHNKALAVADLAQNEAISDDKCNQIKAALLQHEEYQLQAAEDRKLRKEAEQRKRDAEQKERSEKEARRVQEKEEIVLQEKAMATRQEELETEEAMLRQQHVVTSNELNLSKESARAKRQKFVEDAIAGAYQWRDKHSSGGTQRPWQSGFTYRPQSSTGDPNVDSYGIVRRLQPCWCQPSDAPVGYAGQLHYHCKYEREPELFTSSGDTPKYEGCKRTGHPCVSVGVYAKPLQRDTAATFFSSRPPHQLPD
ncbi:FERM domain-containing protein C [Diplonema papillatum]|nr:FERM domain-containing protein C [Diplonema papillatum]